MPIPQNFVKPARISAKERAFDQIQRWIIDGTLQPGEKLLEAELSESLGVSRTPIREAFQLLEVRGLVAAYPGRETRVTMIGKEDIFKLYSTLAALHALAAEVAAPIVSAEQIERLKDLNAEFERAVGSGQPYRAMEADEQFHNLIVELSDNPYTASFSDSLQVHIRRFKYVFLKQPIESTQASVDEHLQIIEAFQDRNAERAREAMKSNLIRPMRELEHLL
ncbi:GntR family transcriptional regulator [Saccharibacillus alkalitolerans]|uniref:GntR family transcriptional regulator n=1 Tax=Saccharibacillus alkalitolerans TaxID=2705290 RepID=A0ABX0F4B4_9BACL|nr:GntR family transcriptional regulator [Saccharibacillus alkalitolerans]NGZ74715.1 GntR family transcriptional regulator [Saccharibacillus alkalitolerans]